MSVFADFRAPGTAHPLGPPLARYPEVRVEMERVVPTGETTHYAWVSGEGHRAFVKQLSERAVLREFVVVDELPDRTLIRFEWANPESPLFDLAEEAGATPIDIQGSHEGWTISLRFPTQDALQTFYDVSEEWGLRLSLLETYETDGVDSEPEYGLTPTQRETLMMAFEAGYFEVPRRTTLRALADELDISEQALSERLRRGLFALLVSMGFDGETTGAVTED